MTVGHEQFCDETSLNTTPYVQYYCEKLPFVHYLTVLGVQS